MYEFCYNYVKPNYAEKAKLCYKVTYSFIVYTKIEHIDVEIAKDIENRKVDVDSLRENQKQFMKTIN